MSPAPKPLASKPYDPAEATREIVDFATSLGFALVGVTQASQSRHVEHMRAWIADGKHGTMDYLARDEALRFDPRRHLEGTRSFIMVADRYATRGDVSEPPVSGQGRIARYARGRNYHDVMKRRLHKMADAMRIRFPGADFRSFVDTAPVLERELAELCGLGWIGRNTMLIHPRVGSYVLLGGAATTLELATPADQVRHADACGTCTRCIDACPTGAISPYSVDASKCVSYLTIERRVDVPDHLIAGIGDRLYGCDVCQEVCPHNSARAEGEGTKDVLPAFKVARISLPILDVLSWDEQARRQAFTNSAMKRAPLGVMRRNAVIAGLNQIRANVAGEARAEIESKIRDIAADSSEDPLVRNAAVKAVESFSK
jgi:epoxyqueuosine reductase